MVVSEFIHKWLLLGGGVYFCFHNKKDTQNWIKQSVCDSYLV